MKKEVVEAATSKDRKHLNNGMIATGYKPFSTSENAAAAILRYLAGRR